MALLVFFYGYNELPVTFVLKLDVNFDQLLTAEVELTQKKIKNCGGSSTIFETTVKAIL